MGEKIIANCLKEALIALEKYDCSIVAGGSDIMLQKRNVAGQLPKFSKDVLFISNIDELHYIRKEDDGLHIGATITLEEILHNDLTPSVLKECLQELASANIRHFATLSGNIANASPAGDSIVIDVLLDALIKVTSINGTRLVKASNFVKGVRKIDLAKNEMIEEIIFPKTDFDETLFYKVGSRKAESISKVMFGGAYKIEKGIIKDIRLCYGSVSVKAIRSIPLEDEIKGLSLDELNNRIEEFVEKYGEFVSPIDDQRSTASYRQEVSKNITRMFLNKVIKGGKR